MAQLKSEMYAGLVLVIYCGVTQGIIPPPDFVSPWISMYAGKASGYKWIYHGLGEVPLLVDVQVKVTSGVNAGFIFQAQGAAARDDDHIEEYGGVMYVYDKVKVQVCSPHDGITDGMENLGYIVYTGKMPYWWGPYETKTYSASVRVRAWRESTLPIPGFSAKGIPIEAGLLGGRTFVKRAHGLGSMPALVIARTKFSNSHYGDAIGTNIQIHSLYSKTINAYVMFGYSKRYIKVWTSAQKNDLLIYGRDGYAIDIAERYGNLELYAWSESSLAPAYSNSISLFAPNLALTFPSIGMEDNTFTRAGVRAVDGANNGYIFPGSGHVAYDFWDSIYPCNFGGLAYGYSRSEIRFWRPSKHKKGAVICIPSPMGSGQDTQYSKDGVATYSIWMLEINECTRGSHNCHDDATCTDTYRSFRCACNVGYSGNGVTCTDINECTRGTHNCHNKATCTNSIGSFSCGCYGGYSGNGVTCTDVNECTRGTHNCHFRATCTNIVGSFYCRCRSGYYGNGVTYCLDINECTRWAHKCHYRATCINIVGRFYCKCRSGYYGNGVTYCSDINECTKGTHNCNNYATCTNSIGSFSCACNRGYSGNGVTCTDINECTKGTDNCHDEATCTNSAGSFSCACNVGYSGNGVTCTDINECTKGTDNCHDDEATCTNSVGSFSCACNVGYSGNGVTCTDINECKKGTDDCHDEANCTNSAGSYSCACNVGYSGNGVTCTDVNECTKGTANCHDEATCTNSVGNYSCVCNVGYSGNGVTCTDDDECKDGTHNCHFGADCTNSPGSFSCSCVDTDGFYGDGTSCSQVICYPNNTIDVHNLPANCYYYAMQNVSIGNDVMCNVTDINSTSVTITGCSKDMPILMSYGTFNGMETYQVHGGQTLVAVTIKCNEISIDGVADSIYNTFVASLPIDDEASADPTYEVTSSIDPTSTTVGSEVSWTISFPPEYVLQVTSCTANPGTSFSSTISVSLISNGGCQVTDELISSFTDNLDGTAAATILAFKFYETPNVYLKCDLKLCPTTSNCNTACTRTKRSVTQHRPGREVNAKEFTAHVYSVLHVVDVFSSASSLVHGSSVFVLLTLTLVSWCM